MSKHISYHNHHCHNFLVNRKRRVSHIVSMFKLHIKQLATKRYIYLLLGFIIFIVSIIALIFYNLYHHKEFAQASEFITLDDVSDFACVQKGQNFSLTGAKRDQNFQIGNGFNGSVNSVFNTSNDRVLVGGAFTEFNNQEQNRLIKLRQIGQEIVLDENFQIGNGFNGSVLTLASQEVETNNEQKEERFLVGGAFTEFNNQNTGGLLRLLPSGEIDTSFYYENSEFQNAVINSIKVQPDGKILISTSYPTTPESTEQTAKLLRLQPNGSVDSSFSPRLFREDSNRNNNRARIYDITLDINHKNDVESVIVSGLFNKGRRGSNWVSYKNLAKFDKNGNEDVFFNDNIDFNERVFSAVIQEENNVKYILAGGSFDRYAGVKRGSLARIRLDNGNLNSSFNTKDGFKRLDSNSQPINGTVFSINLESNGNILVGGSFQRYYNMPDGEYWTTNNLIRLNPMDATPVINGMGEGWEEWGSAFNNSVLTTHIQTDGRILVGGSFTSFNQQSSGRLLRLTSGVSGQPIEVGKKAVCMGNLNGSADNKYKLSLSGGLELKLGDSIEGLKVNIQNCRILENETTNSRLLCENVPTSNANTNPTANITLHNATVGSVNLFRTANYSSIFTSGIRSNNITSPFVCTQEDSWFNNSQVKRDSGFNYSANSTETVLSALGKQDLIAISRKNQGVNQIFLVDHSGQEISTSFSAFNQTTQPRLSGQINFIEFQKNGNFANNQKLLVAGNFSSWNNSADSVNTDIGNIIRLNLNGELDTSFNNFNQTFEQQVKWITELPDGKILGFTKNNLFRLDSNGNLDNSFTNEGTLSLEEEIYNLTLDKDDSGEVSKILLATQSGIKILNTNGQTTNQISTSHPISNIDIQTDQDQKYIIAVKSLPVNANQDIKQILRYNLSNQNQDLDFYGGQFQAGGDFYKVGKITSLKVQPDGKILVGGDFYRYHYLNQEGVKRTHQSHGLIALESNGLPSGDYGTGSGSENWGNGFRHKSDPESNIYSIGLPNSINLLADGKLLISGRFTDFNTETTGGGLLKFDFQEKQGGAVNVPSRANCIAKVDSQYQLNEYNYGPELRLGTATQSININQNTCFVINQQTTDATLVCNSVPTTDAGNNPTAKISLDGSNKGQVNLISSLAEPSETSPTPLDELMSEIDLSRVFASLECSESALVDSNIECSGELRQDYIKPVINNLEFRLSNQTSSQCIFNNDRNFSCPNIPTGNVSGLAFSIYASLDKDGFGWVETSEVVDINSYSVVDATDFVCVEDGQNFSLTGAEVDQNFEIGNGFDGVVRATVSQSDGKILVGGSFAKFNGQTQNRLTRLKQVGENLIIDEEFKIGSGFAGNNARVESIQIQKIDDQEKILVAGRFSSYRGTPVRNLVRLLPNGDLDPSFSHNIDISNNYTTFWDDWNTADVIRSIAIQPDGKILVSGMYRKVGPGHGGFTSYLHSAVLDRYNPDGTRDTDFSRLEINDNDPLRIGFGSDLCEGCTEPNPWKARGGEILLDVNNGQLEAIFFTTTGANLENTQRLYKLGADGDRQTFSEFNTKTELNGSVFDLKIQEYQSQKYLLIGGSFSQYRGVNMGGLARINLDTAELDTFFSVDNGFKRLDSNSQPINGTVFSINLESNGNILVGGSFQRYYNMPDGEYWTTNNLIRLNPMDATPVINGMGEGWEEWGSAFNNSVLTTHIQTDGRILVGGSFTSFNQQSSGRLLRLTSGVSGRTIVPPNTATCMGNLVDPVNNTYQLTANGPSLEIENSSQKLEVNKQNCEIIDNKNIICRGVPTIDAEPKPNAEIRLAGELVGYVNLAEIIELVVFPENSGTALGMGNYKIGEKITLTATPNPEVSPDFPSVSGYRFSHWSIGDEYGRIISTQQTFEYTVTEGLTLVANFDTIVGSVEVVSIPIPDTDQEEAVIHSSFDISRNSQGDFTTIINAIMTGDSVKFQISGLTYSATKPVIGETTCSVSLYDNDNNLIRNAFAEEEGQNGSLTQAIGYIQDNSDGTYSCTIQTNIAKNIGRRENVVARLSF